jgi:hypothetical protein
MQVLSKQQQSLNRMRSGDVSGDGVIRNKKRQALLDPAATPTVFLPAVSSGSGQEISSEAPIMPSLASLCSYGDDSDASDTTPSRLASSSTHATLDQPLESKPTSMAGKSKPSSHVRNPSHAGKRLGSAMPIHQSKVLARTGGCNLLDKLLQKEATADMRTILLCFRAFASRGLL